MYVVNVEKSANMLQSKGIDINNNKRFLIHSFISIVPVASVLFYVRGLFLSINMHGCMVNEKCIYLYRRSSTQESGRKQTYSRSYDEWEK